MRPKPQDFPPQYRQQILSSWRAQPVGKNASKYKAREEWVDGIRFPSKLQARCYEWLKLRRAAGDIKYFLREVPFDLPGGVKHRVDFMAESITGIVEWIEAKGRDLPMGRLKRRQVESLYGIKIQVWSGK